MYKDPQGLAYCIDSVIRAVKYMNRMHIVSIGAIVGPAHLVQENAPSGGIDSIWLVNIHVNLDTN
jgi:hypothetical protein